MHHRHTHDAKLTELAAAQSAGDALPMRVTVDGKAVDTARFLSRFAADRREAWPAISALVQGTIERPTVCEVAGALDVPNGK